jgi:hypothetical protein
MSLLRGFALKISDAVVRYASPGCKEWAEGLAREVAFIKGDWSALAWAIGSTRVLLNRREAPVGSLDEVSVVAKEYRDSIGSRLNSPLPYFLLAICGAFSWFFIVKPTPLGPMMQAGGFLMAGAMLCDGYRGLVVYRKRNTDQPMDAYEWALYYRSELQRDFEYNSGRVSRLSSTASDSGMCLFYASLLAPFHGKFSILFAFLYVLGVAYGMLRKHMYCRKLRWKICDLDVLIARAAGAEG